MGEQVRAILARALGSTALADFAFPAVLTDLRDRAGAFDPARQTAEDWAFGHVRGRLRELTDAATQISVRRQVGAASPASAWSGPAATVPIKLGSRTRATISAPANAQGIAAVPGLAERRHAQSTTMRSPARRRRRRSRFFRQRSTLIIAAVLAGGAVVALLQRDQEHAPLDAVLPAGVTSARTSAQSSPGTAEAARLTDVLRHPTSAPPVAAGMLVSRQPAPTTAAHGRGSAKARAEAAVEGKRSAPKAVPPLTMSKLPPSQKSSPPPSSAAEASTSVAKPTPIRVFVHHHAYGEWEAAMARALAARLRKEGFEVVAVRAVPFLVRTGSVRYFFDQDREGARKLAANLAAVSWFGGPPAPQNFSHYDPKPSRGTVEVWIESP